MIASTANKEFLTRGASSAVGRNLLWMVWSGGISIANSILVWVFMARMRDVEELGRFTIVMGLYTLFFGVCSLGLVPYLVSEISRRNEQFKTFQKNEQTIVEFVGSASVFLLISGIVCAFLMAACGFLVSDSWTVRVSTLVLSLALIPTGVLGVAEATAISFDRTRLIAFVSTFENVLRTVFPLWLIYSGFDISVICASFVAVRIVALIIYARVAGNRLFKASFAVDDLVRILKVTPTFAATIVFASINWQAAVILLGLLSTEIESAKFGVASRFLIPVTILMASYANVIQPMIAKKTLKSNENAGSFLSKMAGYPLILSTLAAAASPFLSRQVLIVFFGENYGDVAATLDILALSVVPFCLVMVVARGLVATNSQHIDLLANALGVVACITLGAMLVPKYGAIGAATAQLFSFLLMALVEVGYLTRKTVGFQIWRTAFLSLACLSLLHIIF
ncbi:MAG TPA: polysaccharide biosynthesis C-terminal domain-containing protein [Pyrinomonadaceae bacterium]|jgi:O-antigen/teichoic acid export membrane protein